MSGRTFEIEQKVVYPSQGVGRITDICEKPFRDAMLQYYVIYLEVSDMTIMVPVEKVEELGIRAIVEPEEAQAALDSIGDEFEPITSDWKLRYQMNMDLLRKGTVTDIAAIVRCLYHRSKVKELPILERKLYDSAKKLLEDEVSFALGMTVKEVEKIVHAKLEPAGGVPKEKVPYAKEFADDDDSFGVSEKDDETDTDSAEDDDTISLSSVDDFSSGDADSEE
ncbi:MAG: transcriptional regulator [Treponemataceae bacterium]|nr:MAG: transcriptional regulator [Treponemataceae bacterium]